MLELFLVQNVEHSSGLYPDTPVLLSTGDIKAVKYLRVGDSLVGDDSFCKSVLAIYSGLANMYRVTPSKGSSFVCSEQFMLTLKGPKPYVTTSNSNTLSKYTVKHSRQGHLKRPSFKTEEEANKFLNSLPEDILDISVANYLNMDAAFKHRTFLFHQKIDFKPYNVPFDPYIIGYWLGDGTARNSCITTADSEIVNYLNDKLPDYGLQLIKARSQYGYSICGSDTNYGTKGANIMINTLRSLNMFENKHIPNLYKLNSVDIRLKVLAGLIDSDGYRDGDNNIEIIQKSDRLADDIEYLAFSLGFMVTRRKCNKSCVYNGEVREGVYNKMCIFGDGMKHIPVLLERKKCGERQISKRATCQNFKIEHLGMGPYYGLDIEGNGRFLTGDFLIVNSK